MIKLRDFQEELRFETLQQLSKVNNVLMVLPTGGGKTVIFCKILSDYSGFALAIAHRQEIVSQMSVTLASFGIRHRIIGQQSLATLCVRLHLQKFGHNYVNPNARIGVAGVDTLIRHPNDPFLERVSLTIIDEAHHVLKSNKWGKAIIPGVKLIGVTATPCRADGHGLGIESEGVFETMVIGPKMRTLMGAGWLTQYRIYAPPSDLDLTTVKTTPSGDYSPRPLVEAVQRSHIVGDVVDHYQRWAGGKLGVTFCVSVEAAAATAHSYKERGVPAQVISAETPSELRYQLLEQFRRREILQLVNVDLFGEGFDLPAIEVVVMARPTQSYALYAQQFGRALRPMDGKEFAIIIDPVGNVFRHGLPDNEKEWTLVGSKKTKKSPNAKLPITVCVECLMVYKLQDKNCPNCGVVREVSKTRYLETRLGELKELVINPPLKIPYGVSQNVANTIKARWEGKNEAQRNLRKSMINWGEEWSGVGIELNNAQQMFELTFGINVLEAQALSEKRAIELTTRIDDALSKMG